MSPEIPKRLLTERLGCTLLYQPLLIYNYLFLNIIWTGSCPAHFCQESMPWGKTAVLWTCALSRVLTLLILLLYKTRRLFWWARWLGCFYIFTSEQLACRCLLQSSFINSVCDGYGERPHREALQGDYLHTNAPLEMLRAHTHTDSCMYFCIHVRL